MNKLPDFVIADLYKNSLVIIGDEVTNNTHEISKADKNTELPDADKPDIAKPALQWLGDNNKFITIVVNDPANAFISDAAFNFLTNILAACKLTIADVAIINLAKKEYDYREIIDALHSKYLLIFGIDARTLNIPVSLSNYSPEEKNNCRFLSAVSLEMMNQNTDEAKKEKGKLWSCLKKIFSL
ncbi:MAG: hypothetical protein LBE82_00400 [Chitinophagaceae bacterium]|jgi:hypothetical protein|nr:hypothetical protein [Chitinophagaceae bacterium]